jgi:hypothetical protein
MAKRRALIDMHVGGVPHTFGKLLTRVITLLETNGGLHKKIWASKVIKVLISGISGLSTWESRDKMTFGCMPYG